MLTTHCLRQQWIRWPWSHCNTRKVWSKRGCLGTKCCRYVLHTEAQPLLCLWCAEGLVRMCRAGAPGKAGALPQGHRTGVWGLGFKVSGPSYRSPKAPVHPWTGWAAGTRKMHMASGAGELVRCAPVGVGEAHLPILWGLAPAQLCHHSSLLVVPSLQLCQACLKGSCLLLQGHLC